MKAQAVHDEFMISHMLLMKMMMLVKTMDVNPTQFAGRETKAIVAVYVDDMMGSQLQPCVIQGNFTVRLDCKSELVIFKAACASQRVCPIPRQ